MEAREKRDLIVLHLVVLYKEACVEYQRGQRALDVMLTWIDNSVPAGQRGLIFASVDLLDRSHVQTPHSSPSSQSDLSQPMVQDGYHYKRVSPRQCSKSVKPFLS